MRDERTLTMKPINFAATFLICFTTGHAVADTLKINVSGVTGGAGQIGCGLHASGEAFPTGHAGIEAVWVQPNGTNAVCVFENVAPGTYAVAVAHDLNGNRRTDTNLLGIPTEAWGVSGNIRPTVRAPRFDEAAFRMTSDPLVLNIEVKQ